MSKNLIIVESPAKAKTMSKYLGKEFSALASYGHVRDLLPKKGAVDTENDFAMKYVLIEKNQKHVDAIIKAMKKADALYLATDPDREAKRSPGTCTKFSRKRACSRTSRYTASSFTKSPRPPSSAPSRSRASFPLT